MSIGPLILVVSDGWARVYDTGNDPQHTQLNKHFETGAIAGDNDPERAYLIDGLDVVPLTFANGRQTPYDDQDYATTSIDLVREGQTEPVHTIRYTVDGRS